MKKLMVLLLILGVSLILAPSCLADPTIFKVYDASVSTHPPINGASILIQGAMTGATIATLMTGDDGRTISVDLEKCWKYVPEPVEPGTVPGLYEGATDTYLITFSKNGYFTLKQYNDYFTYRGGIIEIGLKRTTISPINRLAPVKQRPLPR